MFKIGLIALMLSVACKPHSANTKTGTLDSCAMLYNKMKTEWRKGGEINYKVRYSPTMERNHKVIYYSDDLNISELFKYENYKKCFMSFTQDSIMRILGATDSYLQFDHIDYLIEKPCLDSATNSNPCNQTITIKIDKNGYVKNIQKLRPRRID